MKKLFITFTIAITLGLSVFAGTANAYWQVTSSRCTDLYSFHVEDQAWCLPYGWDARWYVWV